MYPASQRFPRAYRLKNTTDFHRILREGSPLSDTYFTTRACINGRPFPRLGLVVSRRVSPLAHERNRLKRVIREAFRRHGAALAGRDVLVQVKRAAVHTPTAALHASLAVLWRRLAQTPLPASRRAPLPGRPAAPMHG